MTVIALNYSNSREADCTLETSFVPKVAEDPNSCVHADPITALPICSALGSIVFQSSVIDADGQPPALQTPYKCAYVSLYIHWQLPIDMRTDT